MRSNEFYTVLTLTSIDDNGVFNNKCMIINIINMNEMCW